VSVRIVPQAVYRRSGDARELPGDVRLRSIEWALYFAVDGARSVAELARSLSVDGAECEGAFARLLQRGLIAEVELDAASYVRALAASGDDEDAIRISRRSARSGAGAISISSRSGDGERHACRGAAVRPATSSASRTFPLSNGGRPARRTCTTAGAAAVDDRRQTAAVSPAAGIQTAADGRSASEGE